jgi:hypothetical protein
LLCCCLLLLLTGCNAAPADDPQQVMQAFADAIIAEEYEAATNLLSEPFQPEASMLLPLLREQIAGDIGELESAGIGAVERLGPEQVQVRVTWNGSRNQLPSTWQLQREDGAWRIVNFQLETPEDSLA